jgi:hypothetical protein
MKMMKYLHIIISALDAIVFISLVSINFENPKIPRDFQEHLGFKEAKQFETMLYLRWGIPFAFWQKNTINILVYVTMIFEIYVYFVVRNHLLFIIVLCRSIRNSADGWNSRISVFFGTGNQISNC